MRTFIPRQYLSKLSFFTTKETVLDVWFHLIGTNFSLNRREEIERLSVDDLIALNKELTHGKPVKQYYSISAEEYIRGRDFVRGVLIEKLHRTIQSFFSENPRLARFKSKATETRITA